MLYITLRQLEYAVAVADHGSLTEAADALNVSQPSLSVAITLVEEHLGSKLFIRRKGAAHRITARGESFVADARDVLEKAARLENPASTTADSAHPIRLGIFEDLAPRFLGPLIIELKTSLPDIRILPTVADFATLAKESRHGQLDLVITYDLGLDATFERTVLSHVQPSAFLSTDDELADVQTVSLKQLASRPLILSDEGLSIQYVLRLFKSKGYRPRVDYRVASLEVMRSLAANGLGVGISYTVPPAPISYDARPVNAVPITDIEAREPVVLAWPSHVVPSSEMACVTDFLAVSPIFAGTC